MDIEQRFPYDGPHSASTVAEATESIRYLVRYLNNATGASGRVTLPYAASVDDVLGGLLGAVAGLGQLFGQLEAAIERQAAAGSLYDDRGRPGRETAALLVWNFGNVRGCSGRLADAVEAARSLSAHLGNENPA